MNAAKSKSGGQFPLPQRFDRKITHADPAVQVTTTRSGFQGGEDTTQEAKYSTDGKETVNPFFGDSEMKSVAKWGGRPHHPVLRLDAQRRLHRHRAMDPERGRKDPRSGE